ncbi:hypothetical protein NDU88_002094 [Pleurodeles waltl]|uniref:Uncharacterized protein n=1 Tax=Pleurodeles waltl TaxID=8319 RepID=A0AAV7TJN1_PLEWA|nr:hypothetical protein NDU88_002094 [Pleurodeles waltl]
MPERVRRAETASVGGAQCFQFVKGSTHLCEDRDSNKAVGALMPQEGTCAYRRAPLLGTIPLWTVCSLFFSTFNRLFTFEYHRCLKYWVILPQPSLHVHVSESIMRRCAILSVVPCFNVKE